MTKVIYNNPAPGGSSGLGKGGSKFRPYDINDVMVPIPDSMKGMPRTSPVNENPNRPSGYFDNPDIVGGAYYAEALKNSQSAVKAGERYQIAALAAARGKINANATEVRARAYNTGRLSAVGNAELLANMGLDGNMYAGPRSGFGETSRIAQDIAMRNNINSANMAEMEQLAALESEAARIRNSSAQAMANLESEYLLRVAGLARDDEKSAAAAAARAAEEDRESDYKIAGIMAEYGDYSGYAELGMTQEQIDTLNAKAEARYQDEKSAADWDRAMKLWQVDGTANPWVAEVLGVPVGATTDSAYYHAASIAARKR